MNKGEATVTYNVWSPDFWSELEHDARICKAAQGYACCCSAVQKFTDKGGSLVKLQKEFKAKNSKKNKGSKWKRNY